MDRWYCREKQILSYDIFNIFDSSKGQLHYGGLILCSPASRDYFFGLLRIVSSIISRIIFPKGITQGQELFLDGHIPFHFDVSTAENAFKQGLTGWLAKPNSIESGEG